MVSLLKFSEITEDGVEFISPFDNVTKTLLTPEHSMEIQNAIGADIMMQLDDVVSSLVTGPRVEGIHHLYEFILCTIDNYRSNVEIY